MIPHCADKIQVPFDFAQDDIFWGSQRGIGGGRFMTSAGWLSTKLARDQIKEERDYA
jgi:hypothetical protein